MIIYNNQSGLTDVYLGNTNIAEVYIGDEKVFPTTPPFDGKWKAIYSDSHVESAECGSSSEIIKNEIVKANLVSVEIGQCVRYIGNSVFQGCTSLTSIDIPNSVTSIGNNAFFMCSSLTSINIPSSVRYIYSSTFQGCSSLTSVTIPDSVTSIGQGAFDYCSSLTGVTIPNSVTSIGMWAFEGCSSLQSITVEATTPPTLGGDAFSNTNNCPIYVPCQSLEAYKTAWSAYESRIQCIEPTPTGGSDIQITYSAETSPTKLANICSQDVERVSIAGLGEFNHCITTINSALTSGNTVFFQKRTTVVENEEFADTDMIRCGVSSEVTSIGNGAFSGNTTLSLFNIGAFSYLNPYEQNPISQLTSIGDYAFKDCSNMKTFALIGCKNIVPTLGTGVFDGCTSLEIIYVPNSMVNAFKTAPGWITYESIIQGI